MIARLIPILLLIAQPVPAVLGGQCPASPPVDAIACCGSACCCSGDACQCSSSEEAPRPADTPMQSRTIELAPTMPASIVTLPSLTISGYTHLPRAHRPVVPSNNRRQALLGSWRT